ncbi:unnamed protein product [Lathyrus oleraceus]
MCLYWSTIFGELVGSAYYYVALVGKCAGKVYRELVESAYYYVAPEVLKRNYGKEIDALMPYPVSAHAPAPAPAVSVVSRIGTCTRTDRTRSYAS